MKMAAVFLMGRIRKACMKLTVDLNMQKVDCCNWFIFTAEAMVVLYASTSSMCSFVYSRCTHIFPFLVQVPRTFGLLFVC